MGRHVGNFCTGALIPGALDRRIAWLGVLSLLCIRSVFRQDDGSVVTLDYGDLLGGVIDITIPNAVIVMSRQFIFMLKRNESKFRDRSCVHFWQAIRSAGREGYSTVFAEPVSGCTAAAQH
jgi:hypothetical protein